ncbi:MAG: S9 family peptidase [Sphingobacteriales bacterium]|nr:MAG: S9 family peptidase [Sphingobacteriales bacterium]
MRFLPALMLITFACSQLMAQQPPVCPKKEKILEIHGDKRHDPYYWLNDYWLKGPDSGQVLDYLTEENKYYEEAMRPVASLREQLYDEILSRIQQTDESVPYFKNGYWYITRYKAGQEYPIHVRKKGTMDAPDEVLLNVNEMAAGYAYYRVASLSISPDNKTLAYSADTVGRNKFTIYFKDLEIGEVLADAIPNTGGNIIWANDNKTVFFTTKDVVTLRTDKVNRYRVGSRRTPILMYYEKDETFNLSVGKSKSERFIYITAYSTLSSETRYLSANTPGAEFKVFLPREADHIYSVEDYNDDWYINTNWQAKNFRLMKTPLRATNKDAWTEVIPHRADVLFERMEIFSEYLVVQERKNANLHIRILPWNKQCPEHYLDFGEPAYTAYVGYNPEYNTDILRYGYTSLTTPSSVYDYNMNTQAKTLLKEQPIMGGYDKTKYITERLWATAKDGTSIPITILYRKDFKKDSSRPLLLYGYGSYGASIDPSFSSARLSLIDRGFAYAIAHIRGGEEMGREWYEQGKMFHKVNSFTDFIDAAEYLLANKYTSKEHLYAEGRSAGGLLMGAVVNMRPDLWKGVLAGVPFVDVVTTMLDESIPLTTGEFDEWGNPKAKESYDYMKSYSPYDNVAKKSYPNMLVTTGLHDSQVQYFEPAKWVARMRELKTDNNKLLLYTDMEAGHGGASGRFHKITETARDYAFLLMLEGVSQ